MTVICNGLKFLSFFNGKGFWSSYKKSAGGSILK